MKLEPIIQSEVSQEEKHQYYINAYINQYYINAHNHQYYINVYINCLSLPPPSSLPLAIKLPASQGQGLLSVLFSGVFLAHSD